MSDPVLTIWCNASFSGRARQMLSEGAGPHRVIFSPIPITSVLDVGTADPALAEADVALGQPTPAAVLAQPRLRWVHLVSAGYTRFDQAPIREAFARRALVLTNSSHVYDEPCAQHALAMILALARQLPQSLSTQWGDRRWAFTERRAHSRLLNGQSVLFLGFGAIGRRLAQLLAPLGMSLRAYRRVARGDEGVPLVDAAGLEAALATADHIVNLLPENAGTLRFMNERRFSLLKADALYYNIGRGATTCQETLLRHLHSGRLAGAYLDVMDPEPLPPTHPLWLAPNCFITPHTAGGHADEEERLVRHFLENLPAALGRGPWRGRIF